MNNERFFRAAGFVFTWSRVRDRRWTRLEMWTESPDGARHWVTAAGVRSDARSKLYARALALVAQVRALDVAPRRDPAAWAVALSVALIQDRLARLESRVAEAVVQSVNTRDAA